MPIRPYAHFHWWIFGSIVALLATFVLPFSTASAHTTTHTSTASHTYKAPLPVASVPSRYTFTVFTNSSQSNMYVYQSNDGLNFSQIAGPAYTPPTGLVRDPSIMRYNDGLYYVTYTTNWTGHTIGIASSSDLLHWTFLENITLPSTVYETWAPEWFKDPNGSINIIVNLNSTNAGDSNFIPNKITALNSSLTSWSSPTPLVGLAPNYIDTFVVKIGNTYHAFVKNETTKYIEHATASNLAGPYTFVGTGDWAGWGSYVEGPALYQLDNGTWRIIMDGYGDGHYWYSDSSDNFQTWTPKQLVPNGLSGFVRHGTVLKETFDPNAHYEIVNRKSGDLLNVKAGSSGDDDNKVKSKDSSSLLPADSDKKSVCSSDEATSEEANNEESAKQWQIADTGSYNFALTNAHTGKALDITKASLTNGAQAIQCPKSGNSDQRWQIIAVGGGYYKIINANSGKALEASVNDADTIKQANDSGNINQQWSFVQVSKAASEAIIPGGNWIDTHGKSLQAHGTGMIKVGKTYYWFGENRAQNNVSFVAISCYSSDDLVHWKFRGNVLTLQKSGDLGPNRVVERPKVVYNASTKTYVMYLHIDSANYSEAKVGVATSKKIDEDYTYRGSYNPGGNQSRDMTVFQDTDGSAYLIYATNNNYALNIDRLSSNYLSDVGNVYTFNTRLEAPGMFKANGRYYLISSSPTGWAPNANTYVSATSLSGPWTVPSSLAPNSPNTYDSQDAYILPVTGSRGTTYIYMGDRWDSTGLGNSRYIWLPLIFNGTDISLSYYDAWTIDTHTGLWSAATPISYEAEAATNTLSGGAIVMNCNNCSGGQDVGYLGNNSGTLQFNNVNVPACTDDYLLTIYYANGDGAGRTASISINGGTTTTFSFASSYGGNLVATLPVIAHLNAGSNTIAFSNTSTWAPDIDKITITC